MTNPDRPSPLNSETLEWLRTAGFSEREIDGMLARAATTAPPSPATPQPAAAPFSGQQAAMTGATGDVSAVLEQAHAVSTAPPSPATPQPAAAPFSEQQAPMTGAIGNESAVLERARPAIPAVQGEIAIAGDKKAPSARRFRAFAALAIIAAVVAALGFGVSLELSKLQVETALANAQAEVARQTALVAELRQKGEADETAYSAEIAEQTALVAGLRQESEAKESEYRAEISKQTALVADICRKAEAALADTNAKIDNCDKVKKY